MRYALFLVALLTASCSKQVLEGPPLQYSYMPKYFDFDSIGIRLPTDPSKVVDSTLQDYKSIPVQGGRIFDGQDSLEAPLGVLLSERKAAKYVFYEAEYERQKVELQYAKYLSKEYYDKSLEAEKLYQQEIIRLRKEAKRSWLEKNAPYLGFVAGILTSVLTEIAVLKVVD